MVEDAEMSGILEDMVLPYYGRGDEARKVLEMMVAEEMKLAQIKATNVIEKEEKKTLRKFLRKGFRKLGKIKEKELGRKEKT